MTKAKQRERAKRAKAVFKPLPKADGEWFYDDGVGPEVSLGIDGFEEFLDAMANSEVLELRDPVTRLLRRWPRVHGRFVLKSWSDFPVLVGDLGLDPVAVAVAAEFASLKEWTPDFEAISVQQVVSSLSDHHGAEAVMAAVSAMLADGLLVSHHVPGGVGHEWIGVGVLV